MDNCEPVDEGSKNQTFYVDTINLCPLVRARKSLKNSLLFLTVLLLDFILVLQRCNEKSLFGMYTKSHCGKDLNFV